MATTSLVRTDAVADRVTDGSDLLHPHWVASDIAAAAVAAAGMEYTAGCFPVVPEVVPPGTVDLSRCWEVVPRPSVLDLEDRRKMEAARWDRRRHRLLGVDPLLAKRVAAVDLPGEVHLGEDSRRRRDSDRGDRAGRVIGLVRYCPVAVVDTAPIHADCTPSVAEPNPVADGHRMEAVPDFAVPVIPPAGQALALVRVVHPAVAPHSGRSCWGNDAAEDVAAADGTEEGNLGSGFGLGVVAGRGVAGCRVACTAVVVGGSEGSSSRVCRRLGSGRRGRMGAC